MNEKKFKRYAFLSGAAAAAIYGIAIGKGPFNRMRFREQHNALSAYVDNNYPDCTYSSIEVSGRGWMSTIKRRGRTVVHVYFSKSPDGVYVFTETTNER